MKKLNLFSIDPKGESVVDIFLYDGRKLLNEYPEKVIFDKATILGAKILAPRGKLTDSEAMAFLYKECPEEGALLLLIAYSIGMMIVATDDPVTILRRVISTQEETIDVYTAKRIAIGIHQYSDPKFSEFTDEEKEELPILFAMFQTGRFLTSVSILDQM